MLYVQRDENGAIVGLTLEPGTSGELASLSDPDVREFLSESDLDMVRVLEDLIDVLVKKGLIRMDELPESAQVKLLYRKNTRSFLEANAAPDDETG
jgi:hypothetical protein